MTGNYYTYECRAAFLQAPNSWAMKAENKNPRAGVIISFFSLQFSCFSAIVLVCLSFSSQS
jgi:hypothetical protein